MTAVDVRSATPADRPAIERIQQATLADPNPEILTLSIDGPLPALLAVDATDRVVGYLVAVAGEDAAYLAELAVTPARQGEGIGSTLLASALDNLRAEGTERVRLTARADDARARGFYESHGFGSVGREESYYADGADGVVYERALGT